MIAKGAFAGLILLTGVLSVVHRTTTPFVLDTPEKWPMPSYNFEKNPLSEEGILLGRILFYDPNLSRDGSTSCASCHLQFTGFTHVDHAVSHGIEGRKGTRNAPALINLAWKQNYHWDGGVNHLDLQPLNPLTHPAEMDQTLENALDYLKNSQRYRGYFFTVFGDSIPNTEHLFKAFSQFLVTLVSANSKYDQYLRGEVEFSPQEDRGHTLFMKYCNACHTAPLFTRNTFDNNGLNPDSLFMDLGRFGITHHAKDSFQFMVPTLRNIQHTFPYMHDGRYRSLQEVIRHYTEIDPTVPHLSPLLKQRIFLSPIDQKDLIAFLYTLTDKEFLYNPDFGYSSP